ncbi:MAG: Deacetylases, including yeast histone deacetylase and acetoin utilization protein [uncultured Thiotrichaceae bacterium]|uniref:Deacetylases, including yeast histone deacetylase and acetoin utilization protein n=1 Tax=uncultured Thiotrichaceae bacterium TaxID=298394 RepID=A0A6S6SMR0_9GAMM|nr:MAG: Deacetylases, including yeast histone deacetylase and acetoin utilization protein [uncultured Thiotrichaceae bacterium]
MTVALISHQKCTLHDNGTPHHPEAPDRLGAINNQLLMSGVDWVCRHYDATLATRQHLERVHDTDYVERVFHTAPAPGEKTILDGDTGMNEHTLDAALYSAGAAVMAVDLVMGDAHKHAACLGRPPGHHAGRACAAGFCIFNNVAVAAAHALETYGLERVAIIDFDVHHGDGTEEIFAETEPRVLFCSSFQHPFYPYKGADSDYPNVINLPMKAGTRSAEWRGNVTENWLPRLEAFKPQLIIISAGFDSHLEDDMGGFNLVEADYVWITHELCRIARDYGESRVVSCLEGGYDLSSLGRSAAAHIKELAEFH